MSFRNYIFALLLLMTGEAAATITSGYYRVKSYNSKYMTEVAGSRTLVCSNYDAEDYAQVWKLTVNGSEITFRNALTDKYIQGQGTLSASYMTGTGIVTFTWNEPATNTFTFASNGVAAGLHCDDSNNVVRWYVDENKSKWTIEAATVDEEELTAMKALYAEASPEQLTTFFTSTACTALRSPYSGYTDEALRSAMSSLPTTAQDMAIKIKNNSWATYAGWDKTERTFRIADYKAYSNGDRWTSILGFGYHVGRIENPTGIYVETGDFVQVYVGAIPAGESVKLAVAGYGAGGYGGPAIQYYTLYEGMNTVKMMSEGGCFIFYEVDNTTAGSAPYKLLSTYDDVTIHIEGGTVQGYFDLTKGDDNDDWTQLKAHLMTKNMFCLKTKSLVFNLQTELLKHAVDEAEGGSVGQVVGMLEYWQHIQDMEDEIFNRDAIATFAYCNNIHSVTTIGNNGDGALYAYTNGIYFSPEQHDRLFNYDLFRLGSDNLWASAHELGHHRQKPINMVGNTEVSNNLYSNVAVYQQGRYTSRTASIQMTFRDFMNGLSWPERVKNANSGVADYNQQLLHLNWQLYQYFCINGEKTDFFPRLFTALRANPMVNVAGADKLSPASTDYLWYYQKCCEVSGYDLTEFFAAYGFFMLPPAQETAINGQYYYQTIGDYGTYNLYVTQEMIDDALSAVAAMNLPKCNIVFIEDRVSAPDATYEGHGVGEKRGLNDASSVTAFGQVGEVGQYTTFAAECSDYDYNVSERGNVTMQGSGAVGFKLYDNSGNLIGLYNTNTFALPASAYDKDGLKSGYSLMAAAGDGTSAAATRDEAIVVNEFPKTDRWYTFCTTLRGGRYTKSNGVGEGVVGATSAAPSESMQWKFVLREGEREVFDIVNRADGSYISPVATYDTQVSTTSTQPAAGWQLSKAATADMYIIYSGAVQLNQTNNAGTNGNKIYNWGGGNNTSDDGCQFTIEEIYDSGWDDGVKIVYGTTAHTTYGTLSSLTWTSKVTSGVATGDNTIAGLTMVASDGAFDKFSDWNSHYNIAYHPATANTDATLTLTAPEGYVIKSYSMLVARAASAAHSYTVTNEAGILVDVPFGSSASSYATVSQSDINASSTVITVRTSDVSKWLAIADFTVTLAKPLPLNVVGDKSFATLYLPYDVQTDVNTKAYYITTISGGYARLTELTDGEIPAFTAVVLVNSEATTYATLSMASSLPRVVSEDDNLLKGTIVGMKLDLTDETNYYSLGKKNGAIGFYKFSGGTINLGANKAYLDTTSSGGDIKGFLFDFNDAVGIEAIDNGRWTIDNDKVIYNLAGQKMSKLQRGVNIVNGKKVLVK